MKAPAPSIPNPLPRPACKWRKKRRIGLVLLSTFLLELLFLGSIALIVQEFLQ
ncbi:hypothetical protein JGUZn3_03020 [Entomobacter blattae]|uniref:Uncharacterized protein n=1 Tax=Entomobacter blattae TaxID=2762277 RepID=A0A7H1NP49_9PROT|nr:hypothetical protein JGUZn3_03020 [Entomobacter blattae]